MKSSINHFLYCIYVGKMFHHGQLDNQKEKKHFMHGIQEQDPVGKTVLIIPGRRKRKELVDAAKKNVKTKSGGGIVSAILL